MFEKNKMFLRKTINFSKTNSNQNNNQEITKRVVTDEFPSIWNKTNSLKEFKIVIYFLFKKKKFIKTISLLLEIKKLVNHL